MADSGVAADQTSVTDLTGDGAPLAVDASSEAADALVVVESDHEQPCPLRRPVIVDPAISLAKLRADLDAWNARSPWWWWEHRGAILLRVDRLVVDVAFAVPSTLPSMLQAPAQGAVIAVTIRLDYTNYDLEAPSLTFINPFTGEPTLPGVIGSEHADGQDKNILLQHPVTKLPFLCQPGTAEYHVHHQHDDDSWLVHHRDLGAGRLAVVVERVWEAMTRGLTFNMGVVNVQLLTIDPQRDTSYRFPHPATEVAEPGVVHDPGLAP